MFGVDSSSIAAVLLVCLVDIWHFFDNLTSLNKNNWILLRKFFILKQRTDPLINNWLEMKYRWLPP